MAFIFVSPNYLAVIASAIASMILGSIWFGPLFGKTWMALSGIKKPIKIDDKAKKMMIRSYIWMFISVLFLTFILSQFMHNLAVSTLMEAVMLSFWIWIGFIVTILLGLVLWDQKPFKLYLINIFYYLVELVVISVILFLWQ